MGRMKKLYEQQPDADVGLMIQTSTALTLKCQDALDRIRTAENLIGDYIEEGYITDLFAAKAILGDAIKLLEETNGSTSGSGQATAHAG